MKKFFKFSLLALFISVASCEDATDITQKSELNDEAAFRTVADLQSGLNGVYNEYTPDAGSNGIGDAFFFSDVFTDNVKRGDNNTGQGSNEFNFFLQPGSNSPQIIWNNRYSTINLANRSLNAVERLMPSFNAADRNAANIIKGQLLALRALAHLDLVQYFSENYQPGTLGVINMAVVPAINEVFQRNTVGQNFEFINADLTAARELLENNVVDADASIAIFFVSEDAVKAIQARTALFEGNYTLAETLSNELLTEYPLSEEGVYIDMWEDINLETSETIWALSRLAPDTQVGQNWFTNSVDQNGAVLLEMSRQLYDEYGDWDIRKSVFVDEDSDPDNDIILIGKYPGGNGRGQLINHIKLFRSSEMQLIKAECEARRGDFTASAASIKTLWEAREDGTSSPAAPNFAGDLDNALTVILAERRRELCFEGHRYLDLKRIGREINVGVDRDATDCASFGALQCSLAPSDYRFTMPIPQSELNANPTIQQNTGY